MDKININLFSLLPFIISYFLRTTSIFNGIKNIHLIYPSKKIYFVRTIVEPQGSSLPGDTPPSTKYILPQFILFPVSYVA